LNDLIVKAFRVGPLFVHERDTREPQQKLGSKFIFWKVTFNAMTLFSVFIENQDGRSPDRIKAVEPGGIFLDVNSNGNEVLFDEGCQLGIRVRFGFQPSASASSWSCAEIHQHRFVLGPGDVQRCLNVFVPINCHTDLLSQPF
jgi:hypothetical protein